jgi:predicted carbohydrate-binding protein with CBM5 and CBM33 domain
MQPFQPNFNQIQAPSTSPSLNAEQINLGIDKVAAEFDRQSRGLKANQQQMRQNQDARLRSIDTQMQRTMSNWEDYKGLETFSKSLAEKLVENQEKKNERIKIENMNQAVVTQMRWLGIRLGSKNCLTLIMK